jgi:hypothetical protein
MIVRPRDVGAVGVFEVFRTVVATLFSDILAAINGNLEFDKNLLTQTVDVTFTAANTEQAISHNMRSIVSDYIICKKSAACDVYDGVSAATTSVIYLKCSQAATVRIILKG